MFWPACKQPLCKKTLDWLCKQKIPFVPKKDNPPNVLQARPFEKSWTGLNRSVYDEGWEAQSEQHPVKRIKKKVERS